MMIGLTGIALLMAGMPGGQVDRACRIVSIELASVTADPGSPGWYLVTARAMTDGADAGRHVSGEALLPYSAPDGTATAASAILRGQASAGNGEVILTGRATAPAALTAAGPTRFDQMLCLKDMTG